MNTLRGADFESFEQSPSRIRNLPHGPLKRIPVRLRRSVKSADFADELEGCVVQLFFGWEFAWAAEFFDVAAHIGSPLAGGERWAGTHTARGPSARCPPAWARLFRLPFTA